jgi:hypothetical protein
MTAAERLTRLYNDASDIIVIAAVIVFCVVFFLPGLQNRATYGLAALGLAVGLGLAARWAPFIPDGGEIIAAILGVVCGPVTVAAMQGKTLFDVLEEIRKARRGGGDE